MRIIAGEHRGRRLFAPEGEETRPTADRVREAIFNIIAREVPEAVVLDLFGGSGAMALEALSRGAARATIVDSAPKAIRAIARNVSLVGAESRTRVWAMDWRRALEKAAGERFSLVFCDPPYRMEDVYCEAAAALKDKRLLAPGALMVFEHRADMQLRLPVGFAVRDARRYRDTAVSFIGEETCG